MPTDDFSNANIAQKLLTNKKNQRLITLKGLFSSLYAALSLTFVHNSEPVASPYLSHVVLRIASAQHSLGEVDKLGGISESWHSTVAVEIGAQAHMVDAHNADGMVEMAHGVVDAGLAVGCEETIV